MLKSKVVSTIPIALLSAAILFQTTHSLAQEQLWSNAAGGDFSNATNWNTGVPSDTDNARFDLDAAYGVYLTADHTIAGFIQDRGVVSLSGGFALNISNPSTIYEGTLNLVGNGTQFNQVGEFAIGREGGNAILNVLSGAVISTQNGRLGYTDNATGTATIDGSGSQWLLSSNLIVGRQGDGFLTVQNGGTVSVGSSLTVGSSQSTGNVLVTGSGSSLVSLDNTSQIGGSGVGEMAVQNGGEVTLANILVSSAATGNGSVRVDGMGSRLTSNANMVIGGAGNGRLEILNGGRANSGLILTLASSLGGEGTISVSGGSLLESYLSRIGSAGTGVVDVSGTDSHWNVSNQLFVADGGTGTVSIHSGARTTVNSFVRIGNLSTAMGTVNVSGEGSELVTNGLDVGYRGNGMLNVVAGGVVTSNFANLGAITSGNGVVVVDGAGSRWNNAGAINLNGAGIGVVTISNGGVVSTQIIDSSQSLSQTPALRVTGAGSQMLSESMIVGGLAEEFLVIENGGMIHNTGFAVLHGSTGKAVVRDAGSHWINDSQINVTTDLIVESGGMLTSGVANIGNFDSSSTAAVRGVGSAWNGTSHFVIGSAGTGTLDITDGGHVTNLRTQLGQSGNTGMLNVRGAGSLLTTGNLEVGNDGSGVVSVESGGRIDSTLLSIFSSNAGSMSSITVTGPDSILHSSGNMLLGAYDTRAGSLSILDGGNASIDGLATISQLGVLTMDEAQFLGVGGLQNFGQILVTGDSMISGDIDLLDSGMVFTSSQSTATFEGDVYHNGAEIRTESNSATRFNSSVFGAGSFTGSGDVLFAAGYSPGNSPAIIDFAGNVWFESGSLLSLEIGGLQQGQFDQLLVDGKLSLAGDLEVNLINGFELTNGLEFLIADVAGDVLGQFDGLSEGALVGNYGGTQLRISYQGGDGNDLRLFTVSSVPEPGGLVILFGMGVTMSGFRRKRTVS